MQQSARYLIHGVAVVVIALGMGIQVGGTTSSQSEKEKAGTDTDSSKSADVEKALAMVSPLGKRGAEAEHRYKALHSDFDVSEKTGAKRRGNCGNIGEVVICCKRGTTDCCWWGPLHGYGCT